MTSIPSDEEPRTYSVSVRLQRLTSEECHVSVPVTEAVMQDEPGADGMLYLDSRKIFEAAILLGQESGAWAIRNQDVQVHPIQKAPDHIQQQLDQQ
jgi:hypothetical protein